MSTDTMSARGRVSQARADRPRGYPADPRRPGRARIATSRRAALFLLLPLIIGAVLYALSAHGSFAGGATPIDPRLIVPPHTAVQVASAGDLHARLAVAPLMPGTNHLTIDLTARGRPLEHARVTLTAAMPGMPMHPVRYGTRNLGHGRYVASGALTMFGRWRLVVTVARPGAPPTRITVPVSLDLPPSLVAGGLSGGR